MQKDPYRYFRIEARELLDGLTEGILQLEKGRRGPDVVPRLLRLAHTLKGAARVVRQPAMAELAHTVEGMLTSHRDGGQPLSKDQASEVLRLVDAIASELSALAPATGAAAVATAPGEAEEPLETVRVEIREMDWLLRTVTEAGVQLGAARENLGAADHLQDVADLLFNLLAARPDTNGAGAAVNLVHARSLTDELRASLGRFRQSLTVDLERVDGELAEIRDVAHRLRLVPAQTVFPSLERSVRDAAQTLGKRVAFEASGGEVRLDADVLVALRDALMHAVRNAVAHGAESEADRVALGKPATARVRLQVERRGARVAFVCSDDGRGIDVEAVRRSAVALGLVSASEATSLPADQVIALLRAGGLTTSRAITELSGRGIGLDVVRATTARLKGEFSIRSEPGQSTTVEILVPVSISSLQALVVEVAGVVAAIPLDAVRGTLRVHRGDVVRGTDGASILHHGALLPFLPLDRLLRRVGSDARTRPAWSAVVVEAGNRSVAVGVDRLQSTSTIVIRSLPGVVDADPVVSGAWLDAEGNPQLVLDPSGLVGAAGRGDGAASNDDSPRRAPVLVIDDSLTSRMLEQSILESAGYQVELAVSAEEGLSKAREGSYSLFIVDVEMPGMDGFEFIANARSDSALRDIPAILVTSRNGVEDRRRGEQVGARAYIDKGEFDQEQLLQAIRSLVG